MRHRNRNQFEITMGLALVLAIALAAPRAARAGSWGPPVVFSEPGITATTVGLVTGNGGTGALVYLSSQGLRARMVAKNGLAPKSVQLAPASELVRKARLFGGADDAAVVLWTVTNQDELRWRRRPAGKPFGKAKVIAAPGIAQSYWNAALDAQGTLWVAWRTLTIGTNDNPTSEIWLTGIDKTGKAAPAELVATGAFAGRGYEPRVAVAKDGAVIVAWESLRNDAPSKLYSRIRLAGTTKKAADSGIGGDGAGHGAEATGKKWLAPVLHATYGPPGSSDIGSVVLSSGIGAQTALLWRGLDDKGVRVEKLRVAIRGTGGFGTPVTLDTGDKFVGWGLTSQAVVTSQGVLHILYEIVSGGQRFLRLATRPAQGAFGVPQTLGTFQAGIVFHPALLPLANGSLWALFASPASDVRAVFRAPNGKLGAIDLLKHDSSAHHSGMFLVATPGGRLLAAWTAAFGVTKRSEGAQWLP